MAATIVHTPPSPDQQGAMLHAEESLHSNYGWGYTTDINGTDNRNLSAANGIWPAEMASYYDPTTSTFHAPLSSMAWPEYGPAPEDNSWVAPVPSLDVDGQIWPISPTDTLSTNPWSPTDQPLPSPLSDAPSYIFTQSLLTDGDVPNCGQPSPGCPAPAPDHSQLALSGRSSPATPSSILSTPTLKPRNKPKPKAHQPPASSSKRPASAASTRPRTLKRHRSDTPSTLASAPSPINPTTATNNNSGSSNSTTSKTSTPKTPKTTLGGVLPANVDPRVACEQIRRQAWDRCKAEASEMEQRRAMLLDHEHGALEREMERLRVNLGLMREKGRERERKTETESVAWAGWGEEGWGEREGVDGG